MSDKPTIEDLARAINTVVSTYYKDVEKMDPKRTVLSTFSSYELAGELLRRLQQDQADEVARALRSRQP